MITSHIARPLSAMHWLVTLSALLLATVTSAGEDRVAGETATELHGIDHAQDVATRSVNSAAKWVDSFFDTSDYRAEDAGTRIRLRGETLFQQKDDTRYKLRLTAKLHLPRLAARLNRNVSLLLAGNDDIDSLEGQDSVGNAFDEAYDDPALGVQFFEKESRTWNASITTGIRLSEFTLFIGPRVRYKKNLSDRTLFRASQTVRWFTDDNWDLRTRLDLDHTLAENWFFRQSVDVRWREEKKDEDGIRTVVSTSFTQRLRNKTAISYAWGNVFKTEPRSRLESTGLAVRYRHRLWKKWLFYEVSPLLGFQNENDWEANPGLLLRLEAIVGEIRKKKRRRPAGKVGEAAQGTPTE